MSLCINNSANFLIPIHSSASTIALRYILKELDRFGVKGLQNVWISRESIFCLCNDLPDRKDHVIVSSSSQAVAFKSSSVSLPLLCVQSISLISPSVVEPSEIVAGEVWLPSTKVTIIFSSVCVSDSASARGSTSHIIRLLAASEMFTEVDNDISDKGNTASVPPFTVNPCAADITLPVITRGDQGD